MSRRTVNLASMPTAYPPAIAWIKANGLDPHNVLQRQAAIIEGNVLTLEVFVKDALGFKAIGPNGPVCETIKVPLLSDPEEHGIEARP